MAKPESRGVCLTERIIDAFDGRPFGKEHMDDVTLCDAAPELLAALTSVKSWMEDCLMDIGVPGLPSRVQYDAVCAAIAKAKGE